MCQTIVIGHIALIQKTKKQWFTLEIIKALREKGYDAVGIFAGECREPEYMDELDQMVNRYELKGQIAFLGRRNDIPDLLKIIDVLIIPSSFEGFPLAGLEAASAGVPVAACNVAGAEEFVRVSGDGACFDEDDIDAAVDAIQTIINNRNRMVDSGKRFSFRRSIDYYKSDIRNVFSNVN
jgi:glycosyltransferase involved in cell wall biosynthesis